MSLEQGLGPDDVQRSLPTSAMRLCGSGIHSVVMKKVEVCITLLRDTDVGMRES